MYFFNRNATCRAGACRNDTPSKLAEVRMGDNHAITGKEAKKRELQKRFPKINFNFDDEYD